MNRLDPTQRMRESASRVPTGLVFGSNYSRHPMPGQLAFNLPTEHARYCECCNTVADHHDEDCPDA